MSQISSDTLDWWEGVGGVASLSHFLIETASKRRRPELSDASWHLNHPIIKWISIFLIIIIIILILLIITH